MSTKHCWVKWTHWSTLLLVCMLLASLEPGSRSYWPAQSDFRKEKLKLKCEWNVIATVCGYAVQLDCELKQLAGSPAAFNTFSGCVLLMTEVSCWPSLVFLVTLDDIRSVSSLIPNDAHLFSCHTVSFLSYFSAHGTPKMNRVQLSTVQVRCTGERW